MLRQIHNVQDNNFQQQVGALEDSNLPCNLVPAKKGNIVMLVEFSESSLE